MGGSAGLVGFSACVQVYPLPGILGVTPASVSAGKRDSSRACCWAGGQGPWLEAAVSSSGRCAAPRHFLKTDVFWIFPIETTPPLHYCLEMWESRGILPSYPSKQYLGGRGGSLFLGWSGRTSQWGVQVVLGASVASGCPGCCLPSVQYRCSAFSLP